MIKSTCDGDHPEDLNVKSAFLHVLGDAAASVGVILAALIIMKTGWSWVDPAMSVLIGLLILVSAWRVLRSSVHILIEGVPEGIKLPQVTETISATPGVASLHDLHVWNICSMNVALAAHVVLQNDTLRRPDHRDERAESPPGQIGDRTYHHPVRAGALRPTGMLLRASINDALLCKRAQPVLTG